MVYRTSSIGESIVMVPIYGSGVVARLSFRFVYVDSAKEMPFAGASYNNIM